MIIVKVCYFVEALPGVETGGRKEEEQCQLKSYFQAVLDFLMKNGGAAETKEFDALAVEEKMEIESQKSDLSICIKFLLDFGTFQRKEFTLLRNT